jgi:MFS transporter, SP family, sugar:H+ symporter
VPKIAVFASSIISNIIAAFQNRFGNVYHPQKGGYHTLSTVQLSMLNSIPLVSYAVAVFVASYIGERLGRRAVYLVMNCICLIGVGVTWSAISFGQILAGRMIVQAYVGFESWLIPLFLAEMVPRSIRGTLVSCYMFTRLLGNLIISCICYSTSGLTSDAAWKRPVAALFAIPSAALLLSFLVPESPRWLVRRGEQHKAMESLRYLNKGKSEDQIQYQLVLLEESLEAVVEKGSWTELFQGTNRVR